MTRWDAVQWMWEHPWTIAVNVIVVLAVAAYGWRRASRSRRRYRDGNHRLDADRRWGWGYRYTCRYCREVVSTNDTSYRTWFELKGDCPANQPI